MAERRLGKPRTEEERAERHAELYPGEPLPPRGSGLSQAAVHKHTEVFFRNKILNTDDQEETSKPFSCEKYRELQVHVHIHEEGTPSDSTVQIKLQYYNEAAKLWSDYQNGPFGFMIWEEDAIPTGEAGLNVVTRAPCIGRQLRFQLVADKPAGATLDSTNYFNVTISADFVD